MGEVILKAERLSVCYEGEGVSVQALSDVSFEIYEGEFIVVLGPSGSGKSTLLNVLGGMDKPGSGKLWYKSHEVTSYNKNELSDYRRDVVGFVFQFFNLIPSLTARENVELAASIVREAMDSGEVLDLVGLSGREKQRVSIARAVVKKPDLLLCDEPTGALDSVNSIAVVKLLVDVGRKLGCPVVTITHNAEMARIADRVFHMKDGRLERIVVNEKPCAVEELEW